MSLTGRLSAFFLTAMAVVLAGFSVTLYVLARQHLLAQLDARLDYPRHSANVTMLPCIKPRIALFRRHNHWAPNLVKGLRRRPSTAKMS